ncbi:MAG TPA: hypothetical protein VGG33_08600 [Polyangia bacterium]
MRITRALVLGLVCASFGACATTSARPPTTEGVVVADPRHGIPPATREGDPDVSEQRFGFSEARARREEKERAAHDHHRAEVAAIREPKQTAKPETKPAAQPEPKKAGSAPNEAAAKPCPCKAITPPANPTPHH